MPQPISASALADARVFLDRVLEAKKGLKINFGDENKAKTFRFRCYTVRRRELERNQKIYNDPDHRQTHWDSISFYIEPNKDGTYNLVARHDDHIDGSLDIEEIK